MHDAKGGSQLKTVKGHAACRNGGGGAGRCRYASGL